MKTVTAILLGILAADFLTAAGHWFEDSYLPWTDQRGMIGEISRANELHHVYPYAITASSWWENCVVPIQLSLFVGAFVWLMFPGWARNNSAFFVTMLATASVSNLIHRFSHERDCRRPGVVTMLQRAGILCSRQQHSVHHKIPREKYSVILGFTNAVYDGIGIWKLFEKVLGAFGVRASHKLGVDSYVRDSLYEDAVSKECPPRMTPERAEEYKRQLDEDRRETP
jgi:hypothetical protein